MEKEIKALFTDICKEIFVETNEDNVYVDYSHKARLFITLDDEDLTRCYFVGINRNGKILYTKHSKDLGHKDRYQSCFFDDVYNKDYLKVAELSNSIRKSI